MGCKCEEVADRDKSDNNKVGCSRDRNRMEAVHRVTLHRKQQQRAMVSLGVLPVASLLHMVQ
jgi:hypothetical protein